jgi:hypothetical protein
VLRGPDWSHSSRFSGPWKPAFLKHWVEDRFKDPSRTRPGPNIPSAGRPYTSTSMKIAAWSEAASSGPPMSP